MSAAAAGTLGAPMAGQYDAGKMERYLERERVGFGGISPGAGAGNKRISEVEVATQAIGKDLDRMTHVLSQLHGKSIQLLGNWEPKSDLDANAIGSAARDESPSAIGRLIDAGRRLQLLVGTLEQLVDRIEGL